MTLRRELGLRMSMQSELVAHCGANCAICIAYFGYRMDGKKRVKPCAGCRPTRTTCAFIMRDCARLRKGEIQFCFECDDFPCENLKHLDEHYRESFNMSMIENLKTIKDEGMDVFLRQQEERYKCPECGAVICVHDGTCYTCGLNASPSE